MSDCKRSSPTIIANGTSISKKRKITASQFQSSEMKHQLPNSLAEAAENILSSASDEFRSDHTPLLTCCSSGKVTETDDDDVKELDTTPLDPEVCFSKFCILEMSFPFPILQFFFFFGRISFN